MNDMNDMNDERVGEIEGGARGVDDDPLDRSEATRRGTVRLEEEAHGNDFFVCVGSTSHAAAARDVVVGMSETLLSSRDRKRGIVGSTGEGGSVRFGSCVTSVKCESDEVFFVSIKTVGRPQTGVKCVSKMSQPRENRARARMCVC